MSGCVGQTDQLLRVFTPVDHDQHIPQIAAASGLKDQPAIVDKAEASLWIGKGVPLNDGGDLTGFGGGGAQEFLARRHIEKEVFDAHGGAHRRTGARRGLDHAASVAYTGAIGLTNIAAGERHLADRADAVERLPAKAKGGDVVEIVDGAEFAGGVALERQWQLRFGDAVPVVAHAQQAAPAFARLDADFRGAGVKAVFQQFLDDIGGTFDDFASSDFGGHFGRKNLNRHVGDYTTPPTDWRSSTRQRRDEMNFPRCWQSLSQPARGDHAIDGNGDARTEPAVLRQPRRHAGIARVKGRHDVTDRGGFDLHALDAARQVAVDGRNPHFMVHRNPVLR